MPKAPETRPSPSPKGCTAPLREANFCEKVSSHVKRTCLSGGLSCAIRALGWGPADVRIRLEVYRQRLHRSNTQPRDPMFMFKGVRAQTSIPHARQRCDRSITQPRFFPRKPKGYILRLYVRTPSPSSCKTAVSPLDHPTCLFINRAASPRELHACFARPPQRFHRSSCNGERQPLRCHGGMRGVKSPWRALRHADPPGFERRRHFFPRIRCPLKHDFCGRKFSRLRGGASFGIKGGKRRRIGAVS